MTDKNGQRISGLTAADFVVRERGVPQDVREFVHVVVPAAHGVYSLDNPPPVRPRAFSNAPPQATGRAFVFMIGFVSPSRMVETKHVLTEFLNALSTEDVVGVSYQSRSDLGLDFTSDPALIARAFNRVSESGGLSPAMRPYDWFKNVLSSLDSSRHTRRAIVYLSEKPPFLSADPRDFNYPLILQELKRAARLNIPIYAIDPRGLMAPLLGLDGPLEAQTPEARKAINQAVFGEKQGLKILAENTNGLAFTDNWDVQAAARTLMADNSDYYVLGIYPDPYRPDGKFHDLDIRVRVPGARVRSRQGYVAESIAKPVGSFSRDDDLSQGLPGGDLRLVGDAVVEPIIGSPRNVRLMLRVQYLDPASLAQVGDQLAVRWIAIDADAALRASGQHAVDVPATGSVPSGGAPIDLRVEIPHGRITIRVRVESRATGTKGWLHIPLDVPARE